MFKIGVPILSRNPGSAATHAILPFPDPFLILQRAYKPPDVGYWIFPTTAKSLYRSLRSLQINRELSCIPLRPVMENSEKKDDVIYGNRDIIAVSDGYTAEEEKAVLRKIDMVILPFVSFHLQLYNS